jgi:ADP-ribose pyrophosphatase YjhB (NUDIX family)
MGQEPMYARVTGVLLEDEQLLLVKHEREIAPGRYWSLPGGKPERGETLETAMLWEIREESGLEAEVVRLLYVCEKPEKDVQRVHFLFQLRRASGEIMLPSNEFDENSILEVRMVPIARLTENGFSQRFADLAARHFPDAGSYVGAKENIGL